MSDIKSVFLWHPTKVFSISNGELTVATRWMCDVMEFNGDLFDEQASAIFLHQRGRAELALKELYMMYLKPQYKYNWKTGKAEVVR